LTILLALSGYLIFRGTFSLLSAWQQRAAVSWVNNTVRGLLFVLIGAVIVLFPQSLLGGIMITLAVIAFILGAVMLGYGLQYRDEDDLLDIDSSTVSQIITDWVDSRDVGEDKRDRIGDGLFFEEPDRMHKLVSWWVMLLLSVAIATFAILQDSTAVVIGAMLIAPLMTPIMGTAASIVNGWMGRAATSLAMVAAGVGASIALAFILASWVPALVPLSTNSQVTSRVAPTLIDMLIALAAGAAVAYATVDDRVSSSITGVAIAVALVPPLGVVGIALQAGLFDDAFGAFLLFLTNLVSIILAGGLVLYLTGFAPFKQFVENRDQIGAAVGMVAIATVIILVPLVFTAEGILSTASRQSSAQAEVEEWLIVAEDLRIINVEVDGEMVAVVISGSGPLPEVSLLEDALTERFGAPVTVTVEFAPTVVVRYSDAEGKTTVGSTLPP